MATSSERSPPPFPDLEDQELESEEVRVNDSDDDGDELFLNASGPPLTKLDTVPLPPTDDIATSESKISPVPSADLSEPVSQSESQAVTEPIPDVTSEPSEDFVDLTDDDVQAPGDDAVAAGGAVAEAVKDTSETAEDVLLSEPTVGQTESEPAAEILSEPSDDFVDLLGSEMEAPGEATAAEDVTAEVTPGGAAATGSGDPSGSNEEQQEMEETPTAQVLDISSDLADVALSSDLADVALSTDLADVALSSDLADVVLSSDLADVALSSDLADVALSTDLADVALSSDLADVALSSDLADVVLSSDLADVALSSDLADVALSSDLADVVLSSDLADVVLSSDLADVALSSDLADVALSSDLADVALSSDSADVTQPPVSSDLTDITFFNDLADTNQPPISSDLADTTQPAINEILTDPLVNVISAPLPAHVQKPSEAPMDLFEDEPSDLFMEPRQAKSTKQPQTSIFDEPDEDLFSEPLGATVTKSADVVNSEQKDKLVAAKSEVVSGPLSDDFREDPTDIFTEEAAVTAQSAASAASSVNTKTNGIHSEEDIFAEATVELSLDSPRSDRKKPAAAKPAVSAAPALSAAASVSKPQPATATLEELEEEEQEDKFELNISITNPEKMGDGMHAYMAYKVSTQTTLPMFHNKTFTVRRRFSDFLGLYEKLSEKHSQGGFIVPPPPEKSILGMTKVKVGKEDPSSAEFVERRRAALERYLQRVVCHPSLLQDPDVREFLEREELPRAVNTQALSGAGFLKMITKATDAVSKMTIKMNESDVWFEEKLQEVESEDQQFRKLLGMVDSLVTHRKELSLNTASFAKSVAMLGSSEDNTALSRALSQLAEVEDKMEQLHQEQASNDSFNFAELLADYIRLLGSVRGSFDHRMKAWQRWQDAQNMLQKKRETEAKLLWANKPDKLQQAKEDISEWEAKMTQSERDFDRVSATVRKEVLRFEKEKARDFKRQIIKYLESLLQSQQQLMKYWEAFLPEAKAIA